MILGVLFNLNPDVIHKHSGFCKTFFEKNLEFVFIRESSPVMFDLGFILLSAKVNPISKERGCKKDAFVAFSPHNFEIVFVLLTKVILFHMQVSKI